MPYVACSFDGTVARICSYNRHYAEYAGYWRTTSFLKAARVMKLTVCPEDNNNAMISDRQGHEKFFYLFGGTPPSPPRASGTSFSRGEKGENQGGKGENRRGLAACGVCHLDKLSNTCWYSLGYSGVFLGGLLCYFWAKKIVGKRCLIYSINSAYGNWGFGRAIHRLTTYATHWSTVHTTSQSKLSRRPAEG